MLESQPFHAYIFNSPNLGEFPAECNIDIVLHEKPNTLSVLTFHLIHLIIQFIIDIFFIRISWVLQAKYTIGLGYQKNRLKC